MTLDESAGLSSYVGGEVGKPTTFPIGDELTLSQSIAASGGFFPGANREQVMVIRRTKDGQYHSFQVNVEKS